MKRHVLAGSQNVTDSASSTANIWTTHSRKHTHRDWCRRHPIPFHKASSTNYETEAPGTVVTVQRVPNTISLSERAQNDLTTEYKRCANQETSQNA
jgi:hypothetical protein